MINLNELARTVTLKEGKKKSMSIAQMKEALRIICTEFAEMNIVDVAQIIKRYSK